MKIIAEIAQGYEGKPAQALLLARAGVASGADAVKFHCVYGDEIAVPDYKHYSFFKSLEMPVEVWREIASVVEKGGRELILNVGGETSLHVASTIGAAAVKFHATSFFCDDLISTAKARFPLIYISVGGLSVDEIQSFIARHNLRPDSVAFTYGFQASPTPLEKNNLRKLRSLSEAFPGFSFGFEDHTDFASPDRFIVPLIALGLGVSHLEKHLTLDTTLQLEDSESALSASDFRIFVDIVRRLEPVLGDGELALTDIETDYRRRVLKVAVAAEDLASGTLLGEQHVALRRVADLVGTPFLQKKELAGRRAKESIPRNTQFTPDLLD